MSASRNRAAAALLALGLAAAAPAIAYAQSRVQTLDLASGIDPAAAGAIDPSAAELPASLWSGSARAEVSGLVRDLPPRLKSPALHDLVRRVLAVGAPPPPGPAVPPGFAEGRADALFAMGDPELAANLLAAIPKTQRNEAADLLLLDAALLGSDRALACTVARDRAGRSDDMTFAKTAAFCEALTGDRGRAEFAAALVAERAPDDAAFFQLLDLATGAASKPGPAVDKLSSATPLHLAMLRAVNLPPPGLPDADSTDGASAAAALAVERMTAIDPSADLDLRLAAAWRALLANAADVDAARQLFLAVGGSARGGPKKSDPPELTIARLLAGAAAAPAGPDRSLALARLLDDGAMLGAAPPVAALARPLLRDLLPLASGPDIGGRVARALLLVGETAQAKRWRASLAAGAAVPGAAEEAERLAELIAIAEGQDSLNVGAPPADQRVALLGRLYAGDPAKLSLLTELRQAVGLPAAAAPPTPPTLDALDAAAAAGRVGETVLRATLLVEAAGARPEDDADARPFRMARAAGALHRVGFEREAGRLAIEAAVAGGL